MKTRTVYGVTFKSLVQLVTILGYKKTLNIATINNQYGGLNALIEKKLNLSDPNLIKQKLQALKDEYEKNSFNGVNKIPGNKCQKIAAAFLRSKIANVPDNELIDIANMLGISITNDEINGIKQLLKDFSLHFSESDFQIANRL